MLTWPINCSTNITTGLTKILTDSSDPNELLQAWKGFRDAVGRKIRPLYTEYVYLANKAIKELGYKDYGQWERRSFDSETLPADVENILQDMMPMYRKIHAYAKMKLKSIFGADIFPATGHIPAHLLGKCLKSLSLFWISTNVFKVISLLKSSFSR